MHRSCEILPTPTGPPAGECFAADVRAGLSASPKRLPSKYFYDDRGSQLFQQITDTAEYYLTGCEAEILRDNCAELGRLVGDDPFRLVELGVGDGRKTEILLGDFLACGLQFEFVPIDICREVVEGLAETLTGRLAGSPLRVRGLVGDYFHALDWLRREDYTRNLVLFLGSSIGNYDLDQAARFLGDLRASLNAGDLLLIGFDLKKEISVLTAAYNDAAGVTREFNFNLLDRINRELGGRFDRTRFVHHGYYQPRAGRMESWLLSTCAQDVEIAALARSFHFEPWEGIHVENSYKYTVHQIETLADRCGFAVERQYFDNRRWFVDSLWRAAR